MLSLNLNTIVDLSTASTLGLMSLSGYMATSRCSRSGSSNSSTTNQDLSCPVSNCARANMRLAVFSGMVTSGLYLYRAFK